MIWKLFRSEEIKTPRCQDNYLRLTEGRLNPYNNSTNMPTNMVSNSACFYVGKRLSLSTSAVQSRHVFGSRSKREHPVRNASNWEKKINFFSTGDKFRTFLDMPSFAPSWFFDTSGFVEMLWNLNGWIVFRRSRYEKRAGSRSLSHWQVRSQQAQVIPRSFLSFSLFHRYDRSHFVDTLEISGNYYATDRVSKHRGLLCRMLFSALLTDAC